MEPLGRMISPPPTYQSPREFSHRSLLLSSKKSTFSSALLENFYTASITSPYWPIAFKQKINIFIHILRHSNHLSPPQVSLQLFTLAQHSNGWMGDTPLTGMTSFFTFITKKCPNYRYLMHLRC